MLTRLLALNNNDAGNSRELAMSRRCEKDLRSLCAFSLGRLDVLRRAFGGD